MSYKMIYICDKCGTEKDDNHFLTHYELHTNYCSDRMYKADGTTTIDLCPKCADEIKEFFKDKGAE